MPRRANQKLLQVIFSNTRNALECIHACEYVAVAGVAVLMTTLFFGGYHVPWLHLWESAPQWLVTLLQIGKFSM